MTIGSVVASAVGNVVGGAIAAQGASDAASQSAAASRYAADLQKQMFDITNAQQAPYRQAGYSALNQIGQLGTGTYNIVDSSGNVTGTGTGTGYLQHQFTPEDFLAGVDPGYAFRLQQGEMANQRAANVGGGALSGNTLAGLNAYNQGMASQEFQNSFNRYQTQRSNIYNTLASIAGLGQTSVGQTTQAGVQSAANQGAAIVGAGQAQAAGTVGAANALAGGVTNAGNAYMLSQLINRNAVTTPQQYGNVLPTNVMENVG